MCKLSSWKYLFHCEIGMCRFGRFCIFIYLSFSMHLFYFLFRLLVFCRLHHSFFLILFFFFFSSLTRYISLFVFLFFSTLFVIYIIFFFQYKIFIGYLLLFLLFSSHKRCLCVKCLGVVGTYSPCGCASA